MQNRTKENRQHKGMSRGSIYIHKRSSTKIQKKTNIKLNLCLLQTKEHLGEPKLEHMRGFGLIN